MIPHSRWLVVTCITFATAAPALAQRGVTLPVGENLHDRPEQAGDVVVDVNSSGTYSLNGRPVAAAELVRQLTLLMKSTRDHAVYIRAEARLPSPAIDSATATLARGEVCAVSFVGTQRPFTASHVAGDAGQSAGDVRRAIDVQLPLPQASRATIVRQQESAIVLEVLPGPAYRVNTQAVAADNLQQRLVEIYSPRPVKVLYVRADPAASYADLFHAMDLARAGGVSVFVAAPQALVIHSALPRIDLSRRVTARDDSAAERIEGNIGRCRRGDVYGGPVSATATVMDADQVYFEFQVEAKVSPLPGNAAPLYPDVLRQSRTNGEVLAQFVVDTNGRAIAETFKVLRSTHDLFTQSVKAAVGDMRFAPATLGGRRVRQLVQMPFQFSVTP